MQWSLLKLFFVIFSISGKGLYKTYCYEMNNINLFRVDEEKLEFYAWYAYIDWIDT